MENAVLKGEERRLFHLEDPAIFTLDSYLCTTFFMIKSTGKETTRVWKDGRKETDKPKKGLQNRDVEGKEVKLPIS